jgi:hypothetical protein
MEPPERFQTQAFRSASTTFVHFFIKPFKAVFNRCVTDEGDSNPFSPTFGQSPAVIVGREQLLNLICRAFTRGTDPARKTLLRAYRGSGKTVVLNEIQDLASAAGWLGGW